ncbi:MAG: hypothetical protein GSR80_000493 [Desulfurococcales archaeon]|nr:hypothetical protein [Desulfurococcales archaeon]
MPVKLRGWERDLDKLSSNLAYKDIHMIEDHLLALLLKRLSKVRARSLDEAASILEYLSRTIRGRFPFSFAALATADALSIYAKRILERGDMTAKETLDGARRLLRFLLTYSNSSTREVAVNLGRAIPFGSEVLLVGFTNSLIPILLAVSGKISGVHTISYWPLMSGRGLAVKLRRAGIKATPWPDSNLSQAVSKSDAVVIAALGVSGEGVFVAEAGAYAASLLAESEGRDVILISRSWSFRPSTPEGVEGFVERIPHPLEKKVSIELRLFDLTPLSKAGLIASELGLHKNPSGDEIRDTYASFMERILSGLPRA